MTDDLVTRLRALADPIDFPEHPALWERDMQQALREAAEALEETTRKLNHESYCHDKAAQDRTKAELERDGLREELRRLREPKP